MEHIMQNDMSATDIIEFLENGALYRTFSDLLSLAYPYSDLYEKLVKGLTVSGSLDQDSVSRKVRNWINGNNAPKNREQLFQICFILELGEEKANRLISSSSETGIHYRNPREIVYAFCLRTGKTYEYAQELYSRMIKIYNEENEKNRQTVSEDAEIRYTKQIRDEFMLVETEEDLEVFFRSFSCDLGVIHETAYKKFIQLLNYLQKPGQDEEFYPIEKIVEQYLRMHIPNTKKIKNFSYLQKAIKRNWPTRKELLSMKNRKCDVSRKAMLLLFLVTEDFMVSEEADGSEYDYEDLIDDDPEVRLEVRISRINLFLNLYGMNLLDPGNPFDCLTLYGLRAAYGDSAISEKMERALEVLFGETDGKDHSHGSTGK